MERQVARRYAHVHAPPPGWRPGQPLDSTLLFATREEYLALFDEAQMRIDAAQEKVLPVRTPEDEELHGFHGFEERPVPHEAVTPNGHPSHEH
jgi:hypothetical protein